MGQVDRVIEEATFGEVMSEVSLADVGRMLKAAFSSLGCWIVYLVVMSGIIWSGEAFTGLSFDVHIPTYAWEFFVAFIVISTTTHKTSHYKYQADWYFPKLGFIGWILTAAYVTGMVEVARLLRSVPNEVLQGAIFAFAFVLFALPGIIIFDAMQVGYSRLMEKRRATVQGARS